MRLAHLGDGPAQSLEDLRLLAGAAGIRLLYWPADEPCPCPQIALSGHSRVSVSTPGAGCGRLSPDRAETLIALPQSWDSCPRLLCARCTLTRGGILALQMGLGQATGRGPDLDRLCRQAVPLLMWAKERLERQAAAARLAEVEAHSQADLAMFLKAQEEEREWLAYEVHDRVAQTLASAFQQLQAMEALARPYPEIRQLAIRVSVLLRETIREARNIMNDLRPPILDEMGLTPLVEGELHRLSEDTGCHTRMELPSMARLPRERELILYRIFHEALVNIRRHAKATQVSVSLEHGPQGVTFRVQDNGTGFDVAAALARRHVGGLMSMQRRAELVGGACRVESEPGKGTTVTVRMP